MTPHSTRSSVAGVRDSTVVLRTIDGFHQDETGDWVAELSCLHRQHVRHQPPFRDRPWVHSPDGRAARVGTQLDCPLCDRAELPDGLRSSRTAGPFDQTTLPEALQRDHHVAERTWAALRILDGSIDFDMAVTPPTTRRLDRGDEQAIPPGVAHRIRLIGPVVLEIEFLVEAQPRRGRSRSGPRS